MSRFSLTTDASVLKESSQVSAAPDNNRDTLAMNNTSLNLLSTTCAVCQRILSSGNESGGPEAMTGVCGDCRFLLDIETTSPDVYRRRMPGARRRTYGSSESSENLFSQQFSELIALERQTHSVAVELDNQCVNYYGTGRLVRRVSSHTTPSGSRRWRRVFSDTESDGLDSLYGESESNASIMRYRVFHGEGDTLSSSAYGGDSDVSADGHSFLEVGNFGYADGGGGPDSDTDIDPMNAGVYHWNSEDQGEEEEDEDEDDDSEWEEADAEENMVESLRTGDHLHGSLGFNRNNFYMDWSRQSHSPHVDGTTSLEARNRTRAGYTELLSNFEELETQNYAGALGDYLDARGFEYSLEHLAENDISLMGAPPAAVSFVSSLPQIKIDGQYENLDNLSCAICKECPTVGTVLNQLPCLHLYHPSCILPWLSTRNTCPLCRYELPTDDIDYEERKRNLGSEVEMLSVPLNDVNVDGSSDDIDDAVVDELSQFHHGVDVQGEPVNAYSDADNSGQKISRNRWFFAAAVAPIVGMIGISLMLWLGKPSVNGVCSGGHIPYRKENGQRRWWSFL
ncbi:uncharacterized protein [Primulina huaijiensis]|uniref:uncharacterized protein n=1 Tax=Primulina huaijiensis TaxID=1492673 RepID=UPI003CC751C0